MQAAVMHFENLHHRPRERVMTKIIIEPALSFDDVTLIPGASDFIPGEADVSTTIAGFRMSIPIFSAAMDTVTEARLSKALAAEGGMGVIHKNLSPSDQAAHVRNVKSAQAGFVTHPRTIAPGATLAEVRAEFAKWRISGLVVIKPGERCPLGIITRSDVEFELLQENDERKVNALPVHKVMTPRERLITVQKKDVLRSETVCTKTVLPLFRKHRIEKLVVIDSDSNFAGLVTMRDIKKSHQYPHACVDAKNRLRVAAAVGVGEDALLRAELLVAAGVDLLVVDTAHGHHRNVGKTIKELKRLYATIPIVAGNVATADGAQALIDAGADCIKVGMGPGSICTTRVVSGAGIPQITAITESAAIAHEYGITVIADGGIKQSGDIPKALAAGADAVMIGGLFAGTKESPGEEYLFAGKRYKSYRGMGSLGAMQQGSADRYGQNPYQELRKLVPEGIEGQVPYKGPLRDTLIQLIGGLRSGMGYTGCQTIQELHERAKLRAVTAAGLRESHVHDITITKEAPNYIM